MNTPPKDWGAFLFQGNPSAFNGRSFPETCSDFSAIESAIIVWFANLMTPNLEEGWTIALGDDLRFCPMFRFAEID